MGIRGGEDTMRDLESTLSLLQEVTDWPLLSQGDIMEDSSSSTRFAFSSWARDLLRSSMGVRGSYLHTYLRKYTMS